MPKDDMHMHESEQFSKACMCCHTCFGLWQLTARRGTRACWSLLCPGGALQAGLAQWPQSPYLNLIYANFLIEVRGNIQSGWLQLEAARKLSPNLSFQFSIFSREQVSFSAGHGRGWLWAGAKAHGCTQSLALLAI